MANAPHLPKKRRRPILLRLLLRLFLFCLLIGIIGGIAFCAFYALRAQKFNLDEVAIMPERTVILDRNGAPIGKIHGENRDVVSFENISPNFQMSIIAREDIRFYQHPGVDLKGLARATLRNIKDRRMTQGASTITMQLSRNTFDPSEGDEWYHELDRKFLEIFVTLRIENEYSKPEILQHYCNRIFWGHSMMGVEAASQAYLQKAAKDLSLSEAAMLAGIVRGPNAFSPFRSVELAQRERDVVLGRLHHYDFISTQEKNAAMAEPLRIRPKKFRTKGRSYAMDAILRELNDHLEKNNFKIGGLTVHTTIDKGLQTIAENSINNRLVQIEKLSGYRHQTKYAYNMQSNPEKAPAYIQGALVCIDNATGQIIASVGGRDADDSRFNRAYNARRQVGSLFKPFVFQAAYDRGLRPETFIDDSPLKPGEIDHASDNWNPGNSDGKNLGLVSSRLALLRSRNTSSVRVGDYATLPYVIQAADLAGFNLFQWDQQKSGKTPESATAYLGDWEASPYEVARAYTIFPNLGKMRHPYIITKIVDANGKVLLERKSGLEYADNPLSKGATYEVSKILQDINVSGTGAALRNTYGFTAPSGGKTGTTNDYKDAWYAGYTSRLTCAVWVGLDTPKRTISQGYGSRLALPIWADLMRAAAKKPEFKPASLTPEFPSSKMTLCRRSGRLANTSCRNSGEAYEDLVPNDLVRTVNSPCTIHKGNTISPQKSKPLPSAPQETAENVVSGLFKRIFGGGKKEKPAPRNPRATEPARTPPPRAIVVEEPVRSPPPRAIVVEEPQPQPVRPKPVVVKPVTNPIVVKPAIPRNTPPRAVIVQQPQPAPTPQPPPRAVIVPEPTPKPPPPPRAIIVPEPAPPRAIIVD